MIFYRFGEIPENEKSCIWRGEEKVGEGDVIKDPYLGKKCTIEWNNHLCSFTALDETNSSDKPLGALVESLGWYVVGNKFDKKEIMYEYRNFIY